MISNYFYFMCVAAKALVCFAALYAAGINKKGKRMNLKEKWTKQNNSVKMLLRKLKRHDTVVVAIAVVIAVVLCGGLIYLSTPVVAASAKDELAQAQSKDNEQTIEKLDELSEYLNGLDKSITESKDSINSIYEKDGADKLLSEKNTEKMTNTVTEKVAGLGNDMAGLHDSITRTGADIDKLREMIEKGDKESGKAIADSFTNIYNNLEEIENTYNKTQDNTRSLIEEVRSALKDGDDQLSKELLEKYQDLLNKLTEANTQLTDQNTESLASFKEEIGGLSNLISSKLNDLSVDMGREMNEINTNLDNYFSTINLSMDTDVSELKSYLHQEIDTVNGKLNEVFQFVSDGKSSLASALLTKGVEVRRDATFAEIAKGITDIPVNIVLEEGGAPGKISYVYHYHSDGMGQECDEEYVTSDRKGGCYNKDYYHKHTDDCYDIHVTYRYWTSRSVERIGYAYDNHEGKARTKYKCNFCGRTFVNEDRGHFEVTADAGVMNSRRSGDYEEIVTRNLKCSIPTGTLLGYCTDCNMLHGQIVAAKIVYTDGYENYNTSQERHETTPDLDTSLMMKPQSFEDFDARYLFDGLEQWDESEDTADISFGKEISQNSQEKEGSDNEGEDTNEIKENENTKDGSATNEGGGNPDDNPVPVTDPDNHGDVTSPALDESNNIGDDQSADDDNDETQENM